MDLSQASPSTVREMARDGKLARGTSGMAMGHVQANLVVLPSAFAGDFEAFCKKNFQALPLLEVGARGDPVPRRLAPDGDVRTDLGHYYLYHDGALTAESSSLLDIWTGDLVAFLIGCTLSTHRALIKAGIRLPNVELRQDEPMYRTNRDCRRSGVFGGRLVVSMVPVPANRVRLAADISGQFPLAHGGPIHVGDPAELGITDLGRPDWGQALHVGSGDRTMFWACGVTALEAIAVGRPPLAATHAPGHMLVTDLRDEDIWKRVSISAEAAEAHYPVGHEDKRKTSAPPVSRASKVRGRV
jgi:uncharacterized protein YcsI (UPF0317 family)